MRRRGSRRDRGSGGRAAASSGKVQPPGEVGIEPPNRGELLLAKGQALPKVHDLAEQAGVALRGAVIGGGDGRQGLQRRRNHWPGRPDGERWHLLDGAAAQLAQLSLKRVNLLAWVGGDCLGVGQLGP